jgi:hypothetical protein
MKDIRANQDGLLRKLAILDTMMESLGRMDVNHGNEVDEMVKKISTRKLLLMDELFKLLSHLSV